MRLPEDRQLARMVTLLLIGVGAIASVGLTWQAGRHNPSVLLLAIMSIWVLLPFGLLGMVYRKAGQLSEPARTFAYAIAQVMVIVMVLVYYAQAPKPARAPAAFLFVMVPPLSCLAIGVAFGTALWRGRVRKQVAR